MMKKLLCLTLLLFIQYNAATQNTFVKGKVQGVVPNKANSKQNILFEPLPGANVYWAGTTIGTSTGLDGLFSLQTPANFPAELVVSYIGYQNDTFYIENDENNLEIVLSASQTLDEVVIMERVQGAFISKLKPLKTETITSEGLTRLACCNLSESFENNASVDVGYSDAVSGAKHIKMLGLSGVYSQLLSENIPSIRGLATTYGLNYIPGSWMESIQISKGTASVINGYESVTGQINIEFKKPDKSPPLYVNIYGNNSGKGELNLVSAKSFNNNIRTMFMGHINYYDNIIDHNNDGFLDMPKTQQINVYNRWNFNHKKGKSQLGFKILNETRNGGQNNYFEGSEVDKSNAYKINITSERYQAYVKRGFPIGSKGSSLGFMASASLFEQQAVFGFNKYNGKQNSIYTNAIYQSYFRNPKHQLNTGASFQFDEYTEIFNDTAFERTERVPGLFTQYTFNSNERFSVIAGLRYDNNSHFGDLLTPRLHIKWNVSENGVVRASGGKGYRSANVFAENIGLLASSRSLVFEGNFKIEEAWNYGINYTIDFAFIGKNPATFGLDFYRTDFINQIVIDLDQDAREVRAYNLKGESFSNSFQAQVTLEPFDRFEILTAFRVNDVKTTLNDELKSKPFVNKYKGLASFSYATKFDIWQFDLTNQFIGQSRLPNTGNNPPEYQRGEHSPEHYILHAQVSRRFKHLEVYLGGENLTGFMQKDPIIAWDNPFGEYFDTSFIWGPIMGRKIYAGLRLTIK